MTETTCISCEPGTYGINCSESCPDDHYGERCLSVCNCTEGKFCDKRVGCIKQSTPINGSILCDCTEEKICEKGMACMKPSTFRNGPTIDTGTRSEENQDSHSYLAISERTPQLYADVHYEESTERNNLPSMVSERYPLYANVHYEVEIERKSSASTISERSIPLYANVNYEVDAESKRSSSESLYDKGENSISTTNSSKRSDDYLTLIGHTEDEHQHNNQLSAHVTLMI
ncbi:uncharacterized protein LOC133205062 [Saccostrea echinata]|uniref:uncharacterized protein LOC133205062 n=1 Tax=Saccostrea echinata TaxID=191078 RepID=UPI002A826176|nr:uncharacterized protein LOC133205062 [Saccostrea echinata]